MAGLSYNLGVREAAEAMRDAFESLGGNFRRTMQFAVNKIVIQATNDFRQNEMPGALRHMNRFTQQGVRYELDRSRLSSVQDVDDLKGAAFILPMQSVWLKYALGEEIRVGGDVGIENYFLDASQIYLPMDTGLGHIGVKPNAQGNYKGADLKILGRAITIGYRTTGGARFNGLFEIKQGEPNPARLGIGIHVRPMRGVAVQSRERIKAKVRAGKMTAPRTQFTADGGRRVDVPRVVNLGVPQLLFLTRPEAHYQPVLTPGWERTMSKTADDFADNLEAEWLEKLDHNLARGK